MARLDIFDSAFPFVGFPRRPASKETFARHPMYLQVWSPLNFKPIAYQRSSLKQWLCMVWSSRSSWQRLSIREFANKCVPQGVSQRICQTNFKIYIHMLNTHRKNCETVLFKVWIVENVFCRKEGWGWGWGCWGCWGCKKLKLHNLEFLPVFRWPKTFTSGQM